MAPRKLFAVLVSTAALLVLSNSLAQSIPVSSEQASRPQPPTPSLKQNKTATKVYHIGGDVKPPRVISPSQPSVNQEQMTQLGANKKTVKTCSTVVGIVVGEDGTARSFKVWRSCNRDLDAKAIDAVKQWKFEPGTKRGVPVAVELGVQIDFKLSK